MKIQILLLHFVLLLGINSLRVSDFQPSLFKFTSIQQGFRNIQTGNDRFGQVMTFTDLNGDRFTDYVAVQTRNTTQLYFYVWDIERQQFTLYKRNLQLSQPINIEQIIVYDLNQNGDNQLIITSKQTNSYKTRLFTVSCVQCFDQIKQLVNGQIMGQDTVPFFIDNDGNIKLFSLQNGVRSLFVYNFTTNSLVKTQFKSILNNYNGFPFNPIEKHFASTIDLNNDCVADLVIVSYTKVDNITVYYLEVYQKQSNNNYALKLTVDLQDDYASKYIKQSHQPTSQQIKVQATDPVQIDELLMVTFADIDNSGSVDLIFFYKNNGEYHMKVLANSFVPDQICEPLKQGIFPYVDFDFFSLPNIQITKQYNFAQDSIPHFNDVNADGLPDILTLLESNGYTKVAILINEGGLIFRKYQDQWRSYDQNNPFQSLFYDYGQDGKIDLMIMSEQKKNVNGTITTSYTRTSIINNLQSDTLHLKILPLSITSPFNQDENKIQNAFGVTTQWLFTDIDGHKLVKTSNQKFQFNYGIMQLPYAYSGLGRTNNYVEELTVGYQRYGQRQDWSPIIPNSQLMVYKEGGQWKLETLLKNNQRVNDVIYVSILILFFMGLVIFYLNYKEAQQDKRDHYNFIQLIR